MVDAYLNLSIISYLFCLSEERRSGDILSLKWDSVTGFSKLVHFLIIYTVMFFVTSTRKQMTSINA